MQPTQCFMCKHMRVLRSCDAFPKEDSIPDDIWMGEFDHTNPHDGDHGIRFEEVRVPEE